ncbi:MAG: class I SAM-dependent methyltransferase [Acidimicrobiales bacterium]
MTNFFGPFSPYLNHPLLTVERTAAEVDQLLLILGLGPGATVLDVGCGFGRHSLEFARRGLQPTGIDPSETMIAAARSAADAEGLAVTLAASLGAEADRFSGAVAMFTTLGQVGPSGEDNLEILGATAGSLRPGARFVLELPQRDAAVAALVSSEGFGDGENRTDISRQFDPESSRVIERFEVVAGGVSRRFDLAYRLFSATELVTHLQHAGFVDIQLAAKLEDLAALSNTALSKTEPAGTLDDAAPIMYAVATAQTGRG